jgi:hypothetical protein
VARPHHFLALTARTGSDLPRQGSQLREGDTVNTPNPARQVTLVSETRSRCNLGEAQLSFANKLDCTLQS